MLSPARGGEVISDKALRSRPTRSLAFPLFLFPPPPLWALPAWTILLPPKALRCSADLWINAARSQQPVRCAPRTPLLPHVYCLLVRVPLWARRRARSQLSDSGSDVAPGDTPLRSYREAQLRPRGTSPRWHHPRRARWHMSSLEDHCWQTREPSLLWSELANPIPMARALSAWTV